MFYFLPLTLTNIVFLLFYIKIFQESFKISRTFILLINFLMLQKGFLMYLNKGAEQEYEKRHNELWPELESTLKAYGISNYSIFLEEETNILFASYQCPTDFDENVLAKEKIVKKWWTFMSDIMSTNLDLSPKSKPMKQVFHLK